MVAFSHAKKEVLSIEPISAVVFYGASAQDIKGATLHKIKKDNTLGLGSVVSQEKLSTLFESYISSESKIDSKNIINERLLLDTPDNLIWYRKRFKATMWFRAKEGVINVDAECSPLLFVVNRRRKSMRVFALSSNTRPTTNTKLYNAPLMNISGNGDLCLGSAKLPDIINGTEESLSLCEASLIDSQFTHANNDETIRSIRTDGQHIKFWKSQSKKNKRIKASDLFFYKTFGDLIGDSE